MLVYMNALAYVAAWSSIRSDRESRRRIAARHTCRYWLQHVLVLADRRGLRGVRGTAGGADVSAEEEQTRGVLREGCEPASTEKTRDDASRPGRFFPF